MRTVSAKYPKGKEPRRTVLDNFKLVWYILSTGAHYLWTGSKIRSEFYKRQRTGQKYYLDDSTQP